VVLNIGRLLEGDSNGVLRELRDVVEAADERPVTVVLEAGLLSEEARRVACELTLDSGAKFLSTSTGFADADSTDAAVRQLRGFIGERLGVTACGAIPDATAALALIEAGATRLCTANAIAIIESLAGGEAGSPRQSGPGGAGVE